MKYTVQKYGLKCHVYFSQLVIQPCNEGCKSAPWTAPESPVRGGGGNSFQCHRAENSVNLRHSYLLEMSNVVLVTKQSYSGGCITSLAELGFRWEGWRGCCERQCVWMRFYPGICCNCRVTKKGETVREWARLCWEEVAGDTNLSLHWSKYGFMHT